MESTTILHGKEPQEYRAMTSQELIVLTYENAIEKQNQLIVVACQALRYRALNFSVKAIAADLGDIHFQILEAVGHARVQGVTITTLMQLRHGVTVKKLHNYLDTLLSYGLVVKRMMIIARPVLRRLNIIHLPRFAAEFQPKMLHESADFELDEQSKRILSTAAQTYLKDLPTQSSVLSDLGRDLSLHKRHLEMLRSHIIQECKMDDNFPLDLFQAVLQPSRRASLEPKILNCVRYKPPNHRRNVASCRGIVLELGLLRQIYGVIEDSGENGATIIDLRNRIVLPGSKMPYKLVSVLARMYNLKAESIILGKNKAFRLYLDSMATSMNKKIIYSTAEIDSALSLSASSIQSKECDQANEKTLDSGVKIEETYPVQKTKALKMALGGAKVGGTSARRREHILQRLCEEKIISLSSLCASIFSMEKRRAKLNVLSTSSNLSTEASFLNNGSSSLTSPAAVGKVDGRSIYRIATELEIMKKLRLLQLPLPARNVSTKFRALHCVVAPGYEHNDMFVQGYVKNYCRDERLRRIRRNADKGNFICLQAFGSGTLDEVGPRSARKRRRTNSSIAYAHANKAREVMLASDGIAENRNGSCHIISNASAVETEAISPVLPEMSYRIRRFVSQQKSGVHTQQYRKLGFAYGVMYRCKALHRFLWKALHENGSSLQLPGEEDNDATIQDMTTDRKSSYCSSNQKQHQTPLPGIVFSRETVLHSMPVDLYIQIFSGGAILTGAEFAIVEETMRSQRTFETIPQVLRKKIWSHESQRTAKVLGTLADLGLVLPHKIGMKHLVTILRAGYTDGRDGVLSRALSENALGGLFRFNKQARIALDDSGKDDDRLFSAGGSKSCSVNELDSIRIVGLTEKTYSFANLLPLQFSFNSECDVEKYWEALECLCLEQMTMEINNPRKNESAVCEVPKPIKTRARRMLRILAWIKKSQKTAPKHKREDGSDTPHFRSSGIVSTNVRQYKKRRLAQHEDEAYDDHDGTQRKNKKKKRDKLEDDNPLKLVDFTWTKMQEQQLVDFFIDNSKCRWRIPIPLGLQRDNEQVAFRNPTISRTGFGLVAITRKLGKRNIDVKKRLREKLMEPAVKLLLENAKREAQLAYNPGGLFDEEIAIQRSTRLTALFRRAVMMIVSPREEYHPLVAEELISFWTAEEIRLVWRYLWLKNWIVRASEKERGRGYCTSQRLQDSLKVTTLSYPLLLFQQAAEQENMVCSTLEEITVDLNEARLRGEPHHNDHLFEADFPTNATPGQCAFELSCHLLGTCSLTSVLSSIPDTDTEIEQVLRTPQRNGKRLPSYTKRESFLTCNSLKDRSGFAAHLANKVNVTKASDFLDAWRVETKMHAVTIKDTDLLSACEAFSLEEPEANGKPEVVTFRRCRNDEESEHMLGHAVLDHVCESGEEGLTLSALVEKVRLNVDYELHAPLQLHVERCLDSFIDQGVLICVNAYDDQRYVGKEHGDMWLLRSFSLISSTSSSSTPQVVFEGEKDIVSFPWLKMDGRINYKILFAIQRKLLALVIQAPGITEQRAYAMMNRLFSLQDTREAMSLLVEEGLVYVRAVTYPADKATSLFRPLMTYPSASKVTKLVGNVLAYDRSVFHMHYFPHVECIQRFGSIVQDCQNVDDGV